MTTENDTDSISRLKKSLNQVNADFMKVYNELSSHRESCNDLEETIREKKRSLEAFNELICVVEEHLQLNIALKKECLNHEIATMFVHNETLGNRLASLRNERGNAEKEMKQAKSAIKQCERELNGLKFRLSELYNMREDIKLNLAESGLGQEELSKLFDQLLSPTVTEDSDRRKNQELCYHLDERNWFMENGTREDAIRVLKEKADGTFLIRPSSQRDQYALSIAIHGSVQHCAILYDPSKKKYGFTDTLMIFPDLLSLVIHFRDLSLELYNPKLPTSLKYPFKITQQSK